MFIKILISNPAIIIAAYNQFGPWLTTQNHSLFTFFKRKFEIFDYKLVTNLKIIKIWNKNGCSG